MLKAFKLYGEALEVMIPPKRDKWGRRFGFVRFSNVEDSRMFALKLDNIIFGSTKIHVNIPRFQRERSVKERPRYAQPRVLVAKPQCQLQHYQPPHQIKAVWREKEVGEVEGRKKDSSVQHNVWRTGTDNSKVAPKVVYHRKNNIAEVCYTVGEDDMKKFKNMYIGTVRTPGSTYSVHEWFSMQGFFFTQSHTFGREQRLVGGNGGRGDAGSDEGL